MPPTAFSADVRDGLGAATIVLHGDVDGAADPSLGQAYAAAVGAGATNVVLDFAEVGFMNSTGIALIVELLAQAMRDGRTLQARGLSAHYREIFEITRLSEHIAVIDTGTGSAPTSTATPTPIGGTR